MKQFIKFTLASILGVFLAFFIFFIIMISVAGALSSSDKQYNLKENSLLKISLSGTIKEQSVDMPDFNIPGVPQSMNAGEQGLDDILKAIKKAKESEKVKGIYLEVGFLNAGFATSEEIRDALTDFKKSGKYIIAYADNYDKKEYFISSVADKIFINPNGLMNFGGLVATPVFFTDALQKLGVKVEVFKVGTFKSAVEPFINRKMSDESRLQTTEYLNGIWGHVLERISTSRNITVAKLNDIANKNTLFEPVAFFKSNNLVDSLLYKSEVIDYLAKKHEVEKSKDLNIVSVKQILLTPDKGERFDQDKIAILIAEGEIQDDGSEGIITSNILEDIEKIEDDDKVKAVVLRVNSPGGSAFASEQIWKAISDLKKKCPVVVSMGDLAASGGYYISCNANKIVASPNTLTGSIGIFGTFFIIDELTKKLGLSFDVVKTNDMSDLGNVTRPMNDLEKVKIQNHINNGYELFVKRCAEGRGMKIEDIKKVAEGRVWTGKKAKEIGLVDEIGNLDTAISIAAGLAKVETFRKVYYPEKKDFLTILMEELNSDLSMKIANKVLGEEYSSLIQLKKSKIQTGVLTLMDKVIIK